MVETGRFVIPPGRDETADELAEVIDFGRAGDTTTGPPSLRLIALHCSGNRAEKLSVLDGSNNVRRAPLTKVR